MKTCSICAAPMERSNYGFTYQCVKSHTGIQKPIVHDPEARVSFWALVAMAVIACGLMAVLWFGTQRDTISNVEIELTTGKVTPK